MKGDIRQILDKFEKTGAVKDDNDVVKLVEFYTELVSLLETVREDVGRGAIMYARMQLDSWTRILGYRRMK